MKIAIFTDTYLPEINGVVTSIDAFTRDLAKKGHEILIICPRYKNSKDPRIKNITVRRFAAISFFSNKASRIAFPAPLTVVSAIRKFKPDIIHVQTPMPIGMAGIMIAKTMKIKLVQTYHSYIPDFMVYLKPSALLNWGSFTENIEKSEFLKQFSNSATSKYLKRWSKEVRGDWKDLTADIKFTRAITRRRKKLVNSFAWDFTRFIYNNSDLILTPSVALQRELIDNGVKGRVEFQSNGIHSNEFPKKKSYKHKKRILHFGRLGLEKRVDVVIKAFAAAAKNDPKLQLDIVGDGPARANLMRLAKRLGVGDRVNFLGFLERKKMVSSLPHYDLFLTASPMETQGLALLEAMSAGLPVVAVDMLAVPDLVYDGECGYLVDDGDWREMAKKIEKLMSSEQQCEQFGKAGQQVAKGHEFSLMCKRLENFYTELVS